MTAMEPLTRTEAAVGIILVTAAEGAAALLFIVMVAVWCITGARPV